MNLFKETDTLISIVTVSYNAVLTIEQTILSVINQTYPNVEYIIIDGGSTDGTVDIIKKYANKIAYWVSEPDKGIYDAMNKGGLKATGDFIQFLNAGDWFENEHVIEKIFKDWYKRVDVIYGDILEEATKQKIYHYANKVDILCGGPPCQGFSHAGKRIVDDPRNQLFLEFIKSISVLKQIEESYPNSSRISSSSYSSNISSKDTLKSTCKRSPSLKLFTVYQSGNSISLLIVTFFIMQIYNKYFRS